VEGQNVHDHRADKCQSQWTVTAGQQQESTGHLECGEDVEIMRHKHGSYERAGLAGHRRQGEEMQELVRTHDGKEQSEQTSSDNSCNFHNCSLTLIFLFLATVSYAFILILSLNLSFQMFYDLSTI